MWQVIGQDKAVNLLRRSLDEGHLAHAYLFIGPKHVGKMTLALNFAQALNCSAEDKPCGHCRSCRLIASGNHPDVQIIAKAEKEIGIGQIKELQHQVNLKPYEASYRVFIIDGAEYLSEEGANSLLKTLEEPPPKTVFILLARNESLILPTILSRCQRLELLPLPVPLLERALIERWGMAPERAGVLARICRGEIGWAISALTDEKLLRERLDNLAGLVEIAGFEINERFAFAAQLATQFTKDREQAEDLLSLWLTWWRDLLLIKNERADFITNIDQIELLRSRARYYSLAQIRTVIKAIQETMRALEQNANPRLALEVLMLNIPKEVSFA